MPPTRCILCGVNKDDVEKLHTFPVNEEKSKMWQEAMGMTYIPGRRLHTLICSRHFTVDSYLNTVTMRLRKDAVPSLHPCRLEENVPPQIATCSMQADRTEHFPDAEQAISTNPIPGPSGMQEQSSCHKRSPFRRIPGLYRMDATPRKQRLMKIIESKEAHIRKLKAMCKKKGGDIRKLTNLSDSTVVRQLFKGMSNTTADFMISQLRCARRTPQGRRWTMEEKLIALALLKRSPKAYKLLRKIVALPAKTTLLSLLQRVSFQSGINEHIFKHVGDMLRKEEDRYCVLLFDEMDIKENLQYDAFKDKISGFEEIGSDSKKVANKALVFMLQGIVRSWKQPIAYYFTNGACPSPALQACIINVIKACEELAGVCVVSTVCDMGSTNVKTLKDMGSSVDNPFITINNKRIYTMYDPPHLLKCTVSLFRKYNMLLPVSFGGAQVEMEAKFNDILKAYKIDQKTPLIFRAMHKIKESHLAPKMQFAMKVNIAAQLMSHTVGAYLYTLLSRGELEQHALATATFVKEVDQLFDSFNGSRKSPPDGKEVRCCITEESAHMEYWQDAFAKIKQWRFDKRTKTGKIKTGKPPSQVGWLHSLNAIRQIWVFLHQSGIPSLRPRCLNQDALENLFGAVRGGCGSGHNPTTMQFSGSLKTQVLNGLTQQRVSGSNCEEDDHELLTNLRKFIDNVEKPAAVETVSQQMDTLPIPDRVADDIASAVSEGATATLSVAYVSGFIAKKILEHISCVVCQSDLLSTTDVPHNVYITYREWTDSEGHLQYPSEPLVVAVGHAVTVLERCLDTISNKSVGSVVSQHILSRVSFSWISCPNHRDMVKDHIVRAIWKIGIPWWCKRKNQDILKAHKDARARRRKTKTFRHQ